MQRIPDQDQINEMNVSQVHAKDILDSVYGSAYMYVGGEILWREIEGVDQLNDGRIVLEYGRTGEKVVQPDYGVYVRDIT